MKTIEQELKSCIRDVADFPKAGILFKDITPLLQQADISERLLDHLTETYRGRLDVICGIESRGFLFGFALAQRLGIPFVPIRKKGKLPFKTIAYSYALEYGEATIEIHTDAIQPGQKVLIHDDLLASGGTAQAAGRLVSQLGGKLVGFNFLVELAFLQGRVSLQEFPVELYSVAIYP